MARAFGLRMLQRGLGYAQLSTNAIYVRMLSGKRNNTARRRYWDTLQGLDVNQKAG